VNIGEVHAITERNGAATSRLGYVLGARMGNHLFVDSGVSPGCR
jgi:hypothetical protein